MFRSVDDFLQAWEGESRATQWILDALTDESLGQEVASGHRSLGRIAWHLAQTIPEMMGRTGLGLAGPEQDVPPPASAEEIASAYGEAAASLADTLRREWSDDSLDISDDMYGQEWTRGQTLGALLTHQAHHRGQMTVLMRQAGLQVPGVYGPARHEWAAMGLEPPQV